MTKISRKWTKSLKIWKKRQPKCWKTSKQQRYNAMSYCNTPRYTILIHTIMYHNYTILRYYTPIYHSIPQHTVPIKYIIPYHTTPTIAHHTTLPYQAILCHTKPYNAIHSTPYQTITYNTISTPYHIIPFQYIPHFSILFHLAYCTCTIPLLLYDTNVYIIINVYI